MKYTRFAIMFSMMAQLIPSDIRMLGAQTPMSNQVMNIIQFFHVSYRFKGSLSSMKFQVLIPTDIRTILQYPW